MTSRPPAAPPSGRPVASGAAAVTPTANQGNPGDSADEADDEAQWRHEPRAPKDDSAAASLGKAISDVVTGPLEGPDGKPRTP